MIERVFVHRFCGGNDVYVERRLRGLQAPRVLRNLHFLA